MAVHRKSLDHPDATEQYGEDGDAAGVQIGESIVWRSRLKPGWSWAKDAAPRMGMDYCPAHHQEYVVAGKIVYRNRDGSEVTGQAGDFLIIEPGHAGEVIGTEECVLIDW